MPKIYVRVNPRSQISKRHRCAMEFTGVWKETDVDDATRAALEEDPYLEVSETPTVFVEVAAAVQTAAVETEKAPNNTPESTATDEGSTGETAAEGTDTSTASRVTNEAGTSNDQPANTGEQNATDPRLDAIKAAIARLDPNNAEQWLSDGKPVIDAITALAGFKVLAAERDQAWSQIKAQAVAG